MPRLPNCPVRSYPVICSYFEATVFAFFGSTTFPSFFEAAAFASLLTDTASLLAAATFSSVFAAVGFGRTGMLSFLGLVGAG